MTEENRIVNAIEQMAQRIEALTIAKRDALEATTLDVSFLELCTYQSLKSAAQASGHITLDEAMTVYEILGGEAPTTERWVSRSLAERIVVMKLIGELQISLRAVDQPAKRRRKR